MPSYRTLLRASTLAFGLGLGGLVAAPASASPVLVRDGNGGNVFSSNGLSTRLSIGITVDGVARSLTAAPFALQYSMDNGASWTDFLTYSLEPDEPRGIGNRTREGDLVASIFSTAEYGSVAAGIGRLYATWFTDSLTSATKAAAFQAALWELAYDTGSNLGAGAFSLNTTGAVATQAAAYLNSGAWLPSGDVGAVLRVGRQDLVGSFRPVNPPTPAPEPASLALLGMGLGLLAVARRRQKG